MPPRIDIAKSDGTWVVRAGGAVIAESARTLELREGSSAPVIYFPRGDVAMAFLDLSSTTSHCPWKGEASYYGVQTKSALIPDAAWSYESPIDEAAPIAGHLAFYGTKVTIEEV